MTKHELIESNMNLVYYVLHKYYPTFVKDEDMVQVGMVGLCKAANTWDGVSSKFSTYAVACILQEIHSEYRRRSQTIPTISLDKQLYSDNSDFDLSDILPSEDVNFDDGVELERFKELLNEDDLVILKYMFDGVRQIDVATKLGLTKGAVNERVRRIRRKWRMYNGNNKD